MPAHVELPEEIQVATLLAHADPGEEGVGVEGELLCPEELESDCV